MSDQNIIEGRNHYAKGDAETRAWFHKQWAMWPNRAVERFTTNICFHYGGVKAYRAEHGKEPELSEEFAENVSWLDKNSQAVKEKGQ